MTIFDELIKNCQANLSLFEKSVIQACRLLLTLRPTMSNAAVHTFRTFMENLDDMSQLDWEFFVQTFTAMLGSKSEETRNAGLEGMTAFVSHTEEFDVFLNRFVATSTETAEETARNSIWTMLQAFPAATDTVKEFFGILGRRANSVNIRVILALFTKFFSKTGAWQANTDYVGKAYETLAGSSHVRETILFLAQQIDSVENGSTRSIMIELIQRLAKGTRSLKGPVIEAVSCLMRHISQKETSSCIASLMENLNPAEVAEVTELLVKAASSASGEDCKLLLRCARDCSEVLIRGPKFFASPHFAETVQTILHLSLEPATRLNCLELLSHVLNSVSRLSRPTVELIANCLYRVLGAFDGDKIDTSIWLHVFGSMRGLVEVDLGVDTGFTIALLKRASKKGGVTYADALEWSAAYLTLVGTTHDRPRLVQYVASVQERRKASSPMSLVLEAVGSSLGRRPGDPANVDLTVSQNNAQIGFDEAEISALVGEVAYWTPASDDAKFEELAAASRSVVLADGGSDDLFPAEAVAPAPAKQDSVDMDALEKALSESSSAKKTRAPIPKFEESFLALRERLVKEKLERQALEEAVLDDFEKFIKTPGNLENVQIPPIPSAADV